MGSTLSLGRDSSIAKALPFPAESLDVLSTLRRSLIRLALDEEDPSAVVARAARTISVCLGCSCSFVEQAVAPDQVSGYIAMEVSSDELLIGTFLIESAVLEIVGGITPDDIREIADLVGLCVVQAKQGQEISELQVESEEMLFHAPDLIFVLDGSGSVKMANRIALELVGKPEEEVVGRGFARVVGKDAPEMASLLEIAAEGDRFELELEGAKGRRLASFSVSVVGEGEQLLCVGRDITSERQAELAVRQGGRSVLMSQTIDYVLHEVNNPLAALMASIAVASRKDDRVLAMLRESASHNPEIFDALQKLSESLDRAQRAGERIHEAMRMLGSANRRREMSAPEEVDLRAEIAVAVTSVENRFKGVKVRVDLPDLPRIKAAPLQMSEVFSALLTNAVQAAEEGTEPRIELHAQVMDDIIVISVDDDGHGVDERYREKIFMPFFTTKSLDDSIGLGLSMALDIVRRSKGTLEHHPRKPGGSTFKVTLPSR